MSLARDFTTVGSGTLLSRLLAYVRDAGIAATLGTGPVSEAYFAVLQLVNVFRRPLSEGALNAAFVPIWLRLRAHEDGAANANRFTLRVLVTMLCVSGILTLLIVVFAPQIVVAIAPGFDPALRGLATLFTVLASPYVLLAGLAAVIAAAMNAENRVGVIAASTLLFNGVMVGVVVFLYAASVAPGEAGFWLIGAIVAAALVQLALTGVAWLATGDRRQRARVREADETGRFFRRALPGLIATGVPQFKLIAATAIVSASPAAVSWLYYANRLYELPLGIASVGVAAVIVPRIAGTVRSGDEDLLAAAQSRAYEIALGLALPAAAGFALLAEPIARGLFERGAFGAADTTAVAAAMVAMCAGLPGHVLEKTFGAVSFAHEDTHTPMIAALAGLAAAITLGIVLFARSGYVGVAAAIAVSGWVGAGLLGVILLRRSWLRIDAGARRRLPRIGLATIAMAGAVGGAHRLIGNSANAPAARLAILAVLVALGVAVYLAALRLLGVATLRELTALPHRS
ncbi:MAG TPA: murein biosynthesis integral membrane protein MurJ [Pseudolabrys sp.]|nr:murein biosynthesis integral membrane protein MurJ [Pseudolabrys sp.]